LAEKCLEARKFNRWRFATETLFQSQFAFDLAEHSVFEICRLTASVEFRKWLGSASLQQSNDFKLLDSTHREPNGLLIPDATKTSSESVDNSHRRNAVVSGGRSIDPNANLREPSKLLTSASTPLSPFRSAAPGAALESTVPKPIDSSRFPSLSQATKRPNSDEPVPYSNSEVVLASATQPSAGTNMKDGLRADSDLSEDAGERASSNGNAQFPPGESPPLASIEGTDIDHQFLYQNPVLDQFANRILASVPKSLRHLSTDSRVIVAKENLDALFTSPVDSASPGDLTQRFSPYVMSPFLYDWKAATQLENQIRTGADLSALETPLAIAHPVTQRPTLDGHLQESMWIDAPSTLMSDIVPIQQQPSRVQVLCDSEYLYVGITGPGITHPKSNHSQVGRALTQPSFNRQEDYVELFLDVDRDRQTRYAFAVGANGATHDSVAGVEAWEPDWYVATHTETSANGQSIWTVEMAIPIAELVDRPPTAEDVWVLNARRVMKDVGCQTCISDLSDGQRVHVGIPLVFR
jgi:hypothetical protein